MVDREEEDGRRYVNFGVAEEEDEVLSLQVVSEEEEEEVEEEEEEEEEEELSKSLEEEDDCCKHYSQDDTENFESDEYRENQESSRVKPDSPVNYQTYLQYREMRGNAGARCVAQVETENGPRSDRTEFQRWII
ncbi:hypothetical protein AXX17_AT2G17040 [Arabidopsis thaliana]|uniref:Uncharacterized protein n=1 Tax=Arabidopsis thaliana TaxID=3702 RepID=A0A178VM23_ARATH|nr:hypothetical protein AXX17_AT2G17040 [Arabidopsis thaliana]